MDDLQRVTPGELKSVTAEVLGLPHNAVDYPYRVLRENGLVSRGGRGRSAVSVSPRDAAMLLTAMCGQLPGQDILISTKEYAFGRVNGEIERASGDLISWKPEELIWNDPRGVAPSLARLEDDHTFIDVLAALIEDAATGSLCAEPGISLPYNSQKCRIAVHLIWPLCISSVHILFPQYPREKYNSGKVYRLNESNLRWSLGRAGDLRQERWFSQNALLALGHLFGGPAPETLATPLAAREGH